MRTKVALRLRVTAVAGALACVSLIGTGAVSGASAPTPSSPAAPAAAPQGLNPSSAAAGPEKGKVSPRLETLAQPIVSAESPAQKASAVGVAPNGAGSLIPRSGGRYLVEIRVSNTSASTIAAVTAAGAAPEFVSAQYGVVIAALAPADADAVAAVPAVLAVTEALAPDTSAAPVCSAGVTPIVSEGDTQLNASAARDTSGADGRGVTVGVISDSFDTNAGAPTHAAGDVTSGELPGVTNPCGRLAPVLVQADTFAAEDEGRAMAQIVHDLAPGATLRFATGLNTDVQMASQIEGLAANGASVIVDDFQFSDEPMYQDGPIAVAIDDVRANHDVAYFTSADNDNVIVGGQNVGSYEPRSGYRPATCPLVNGVALPGDCHDFDPGAGVDTDDSITLTCSVASPCQIPLRLGWDEPMNGVTTDLDLYLLNSAGNVVASSTAASPTTGSPNEAIFPSITASGTYRIVVNRYNGVAGGTPPFRLVFRGDYLQNRLTAVEYHQTNGNDVVGPTLYGHAAALNAASVAAVPYSNNATPEQYSARGPGYTCWQPAVGTTPAAAISPCVAKNPDITAIDGAANSFFGQLDANSVWRFYGTSAAAPHAAAVAALERQLRPCATAAQVISAQRASGRAIGTFGADTVGSGLLDASATLANLPTCANDNFANAQVISGSSGTVTGSNFGASKEAGEPATIAGNAGGASIWYRWTAPATGSLTVDTLGSTDASANALDTLLGVYTGNALGSLVCAPGCDNDDISVGNLASSVTIPVVANTTYQILVDGYKPSTGPAHQGTIKLNWSETATLPAHVSTTLTRDLTNPQVGQRLTFTSVVTNDGGSSATGVDVVFSLDPSYGSVLGATTQGSCQAEDVTFDMHCPVGAIAPGASVTVTAAVTPLSQLNNTYASVVAYPTNATQSTTQTLFTNVAAATTATAPVLGMVDSAGNAYVKVGSLTSAWTKVTSGATAIAVATDPTNGPLIAINTATGVYAKQGSVTGPWTHESAASVGATSIAVATDSTHGPLIAINTPTGVYAKQGTLTTAWTHVTAANIGVTAIAVATDSTHGPLIAINTPTGTYAKQGSLTAAWTHETAANIGVTAIAVATDATNGPLIAINTPTGVYAKQGTLTAAWAHETAASVGATAIAVATDATHGPLVGINTPAGVYAKQGTLTTPWTHETATNVGVTAISVASDTTNGPLVGINTPTGIYAKQGTLTTAWTHETAAAAQAISVAG